MRSFNRNIATLLIGVFAFFFCGNTVFMHSHVVNGSRIVHSHPFKHGDQHSHTQNALLLITSANATAATMEAVHEFHAPEPELSTLGSVTLQIDSDVVAIDNMLSTLRGPPALSAA